MTDVKSAAPLHNLDEMLAAPVTSDNAGPLVQALLAAARDRAATLEAEWYQDARRAADALRALFPAVVLLERRASHVAWTMPGLPGTSVMFELRRGRTARRLLRDKLLAAEGQAGRPRCLVRRLPCRGTRAQ